MITWNSSIFHQAYHRAKQARIPTKSSVLEAISGVSFPIKSNLCTRFPTELMLRKTSHIDVNVSIVSHYSRSEFEQLFFNNFYEKLDDFEELLILIKNVKTIMKILTYDKTFSKNLFRVKISSLDRSHLIIINLFKFIHFKTK